jgi:hypothetical protein
MFDILFTILFLVLCQTSLEHTIQTPFRYTLILYFHLRLRTEKKCFLFRLPNEMITNLVAFTLLIRLRHRRNTVAATVNKGINKTPLTVTQSELNTCYRREVSGQLWLLDECKKNWAAVLGAVHDRI